MNISDILSDNKDKILTVGSVVGIFGSLAATIWGTRKATKMAIEKGVSGKEEFKLTWKWYLPGTILVILSSCSVVFSNIEAEKKVTVLAGEYIGLRAMMDNLHDNISEEYGKEKADELFQKSKQGGMDKNYMGFCLEDEPEFDKNGPDDKLFIDSFTGIEFYAQLPFMQLAREGLNQLFAFQKGNAVFEQWAGLIQEDVPFEFYIENGSNLGWSSLEGTEWIGIHYRLVDDQITGNTYYSIEYDVEPYDLGISSGEIIPEGVYEL